MIWLQITLMNHDTERCEKLPFIMSKGQAEVRTTAPCYTANTNPLWGRVREGIRCKTGQSNMRR